MSEIHTFRAVPATIKDVAFASNSSITTVSRVLSGSGYPVSDKLKKRILKTAKELDYVPNLTARSLKTNTSTEIAVIFPSIINPYYTAIIKGMEDYFFRENLGMLIYITGKNGREPEAVIDSIRSRKIAGVIAATDSVSDAFLKDLTLMKNAGTPVLLVDYKPVSEQGNDMHGVYFDYFMGAGMAAEYLLDAGHRKIAFATTHLDRQSRVLRYDGFRDALRRRGVPFDESRLLTCTMEVTYRAGVELADKIAGMRDNITAVAVINDVVAAGILTGLNIRGIRVPTDISIIGFDNGDLAEMTNPLLTTVNVPAEKIGELAATSLISGIKNKAEPSSTFLLPAIVERNSVCKIDAA